MLETASVPEIVAEKKVGEAITRITEKIPELEAKNGSMWVFKQVMRIDMQHP
eukprot:SAG22_NODE_211_length_15079_cov_14.083906_1_plen_52_part_00